MAWYKWKSRSTLLNSVHFFERTDEIEDTFYDFATFTCLNDIYKKVFDENIKTLISFENNFNQDLKGEIVFD